MLKGDTDVDTRESLLDHSTRTIWNNYMNFIRKYDFTILLCLYFFLLPISKTLWYPLLVMAIVGGVLLVRDLRNTGLQAGTKWLLGLGGCIWAPALLSIPGSIDIGRSLVFVGTYPLFFLASYFLYARLKQGVSITPALTGITLIVLMWGVLAIWQYLDPSNPFGPGGTHNQGMHTPNNPYYDGGLMMGVILGSLFAFVSISLWAKGHYVSAIAAGLFIAGLCWISGTRSSWISVLTTLLALPVLAWVRGYKPNRRDLSVMSALFVIVLLAGGWITKQSGLGDRLEKTLIAFQNPSYDSVNEALSLRLDIWTDALAVGNENPWFGAGVNNYRFAAPMLESPAGTLWITEVTDPDSPHKLQGAAHTHQVIMETLAGSGWVGVAGLLLFYILLTRLTLSIFRQPNLVAAASVLAFWAYFWPINTHNNFYGGWVNAWFWVWLGLTLGAYYAPSHRQSPKVSSVSQEL